MKALRLAAYGLFMLACALTGAQQAEAASIYDGAIVNTSTLELSPFPNKGCDMTQRWITTNIDGEVNEALINGNYHTARANFEAKQHMLVLQNYAWHGGTQYPTQYRIVFSNQAQDPIESWTAEGWWRNEAAWTIIDIGSSSTAYTSQCDLTPTVLGVYENETVFNVHNPTWDHKLYYSDIPFTAPENYEGESPTPVGSIQTPMDEKPMIRMDHVNNWVASFSEQRFYAFDEPPFVCADGFTPRMTLEIWRKNTAGDELLLSDTVSANSKLDYTFPKIAEVRDYEIVSWFSCTDGTPFAEGASFYPFSLSEKGSLVVTPNVAECLTAAEPYFDLGGCTNNMKTATEALSFGTLKIGGNWSFTENCHQLTVIDNWLHMEEAVLCPQVPADVRNVITPFVTLAMAFLGLKFINSQFKGAY